jgi:hypothetical protein
MGLHTRSGINVHDLEAAYHEGIADERAVTAPGNCLGAHDDGYFLSGKFNEFINGRSKLRCLHIVGKTAKGGIVPAGIWRIDPAMAQSPQFFQVPVPDSAIAEKLTQRIPVELRVMTGSGDGPDIYQPLYAVNPQQLDKFIEGLG